MFFKKRFSPDLVNLEEYRYTLLTCLDNGGELRPFPTIPGLVELSWSCEEMEAMRINRRLAQDIFEEMKARKNQ